MGATACNQLSGLEVLDAGRGKIQEAELIAAGAVRSSIHSEELQSFTDQALPVRLSHHTFQRDANRDHLMCRGAETNGGRHARVTVTEPHAATSICIPEPVRMRNSITILVELRIRY